MKRGQLGSLGTLPAFCCLNFSIPVEVSLAVLPFRRLRSVLGLLPSTLPEEAHSEVDDAEFKLYGPHFLFAYKQPSFVSDLHGGFNLTFCHAHEYFLLKMTSLSVSVNFKVLFKNESSTE